MCVDEYNPAALEARRTDTSVILGGTSEFAVEIHVIDNIDWDDEEADFRGEDGALRLISGEAISLEHLRADGHGTSIAMVHPESGTRHHERRAPQFALSWPNFRRRGSRRFSRTS